VNNDSSKEYKITTSTNNMNLKRKKIRTKLKIHLFGIVPELLLPNSHSYQTNALHSFGSEHPIRFIICINQNSF